MPKKGFKHREDSKRKIGLKSKKAWERPGYRKMMSEKHKGQVAWNKNLTKETDDISKIILKQERI